MGKFDERVWLEGISLWPADDFDLEKVAVDDKPVEDDCRFPTACKGALFVELNPHVQDKKGNAAARSRIKEESRLMVRKKSPMYSSESTTTSCG